MSNLSNFNTEVFTIINQIPISGEVNTKVGWKKHILRRCAKKDGLYDKSSGTMFFKANTWTAYLYDWQDYKAPGWIDDGYYALSEDEKEAFYTVNVGDLLVFGEIPDAEPTNIQEFNALVKKYRDNGGLITGCETYIKYKPNGNPWKTNHIEIIKG